MKVKTKTMIPKLKLSEIGKFVIFPKFAQLPDKKRNNQPPNSDQKFIDGEMNGKRGKHFS